ncbi:MAG: bifunctional N-acetylglucosamine-1-phosphate uridyltransferase/glucosamine-1-phosphate acetyltransferase [Candidatus Omnitrophica bacterium]|nr:bifunctional N-acetylglucosamine-1-phosphate uridyltransferase/glucosamine-1-phosphate acetyltransferase [Candidatus Omnitrophota bacterium]
MRTLHAMILAAGEGTRMKSDRPKVLHPICGRPMIAYALDLAAASGVKQPIVVLGHGADAVKPFLPKEAKVVMQPARRGTGDAVAAAKKALGGGSGAVLILYADTPLLRRTTVQKLIETHFKTGATCTLLTAHLADPGGYGRIVRNEGGQIAEIVEDAEANAAQRAIREVNVGPLVCNAQSLLDALAMVKPSRAKHELYLTDIVSHLARQEGTKIQATRVEEIWEALGINSRSELARAIGVIRQRIIETHLHNGVTIEDPSTTFIDQGVSIGADTTIHPYTVIETGVAIGKRCSIGPFARLRSGVTVGEEARIGNFAELVRTKVGPRVRINHVSYLGDAVIEEGANIGAGTITANYDGREKHQTQIGKEAFIGSDTVLIAPVKIGAGAVTGAGSVVTKDHDVPARGVVAGVPARPLDHRASESPEPGTAKDGRLVPQPISTKQRAAAPRRLAKPSRARPRVKPTPARKTTARVRRSLRAAAPKSRKGPARRRRPASRR